MSRPMLPPVAALAVGVSSLPLTRRKHHGTRILTPAQRMIAGRAFSSAAEQATSTWSDPPALRCRRKAVRERPAGDPSLQLRVGRAPSSVPSLCGGR
jgi:hypothetical protein